ncbi:MAG: PepSY domain-containing protein [Sulfuricella sp.]|jgi:uncharacterized membrane protein YkoI
MKRLALLCALILPAVAAAELWQAPAHRLQAEGGRPAQARITMGDAMNKVQQAFGGRVIQAQPASVNGREGYRIKVLTSRGEVRVVYVDGETGAIQ